LPSHCARLSSRLPDRVRSDYLERAKGQGHQPDKVKHFKQSWNEKFGRIQIGKWSENEFEILDSVNIRNGEQAEIHRLVFGESADWLYRVTRHRQRPTAEFRGAKIPIFERSGAGNCLALAISDHGGCLLIET
jgi:hypothetical protein